MKQKFKFNKKAYDNGLDLNIHIDFIQCKDNPEFMNLLTCSISKGNSPSYDIADTINEHTLTDIINEFIEQ